MTADTEVPPERHPLLPRGRFTKLLLLLLGMLVAAPIIEAFLRLRLLLEDVFLTAVFIYATYSLGRDKRLLALALGLAVPAIALTWLAHAANQRWLTMAGGMSEAAFMLTVTFAILAHIFRQQAVTADMIAGAIVVYLLMAVMWSQLYWVLECIRPGQFSPPVGQGPITPALLRYFSFVTITTVGYGDVTPLTPVARALANLEAVMGQLYLVIQVAWLVGMHVTMKSK